MKERITYIDVAKCIAIWLMIVGHGKISHISQIYIYSFHMPLFFIISGMFFKKEKLFVDNLKSSVRTLLIPYFFFSLINLTVCWVHPYLHPELYYNMHGISIFYAAIKGMFIGSDYVTKTSFMPFGPLWFLVALFIVKNMASLLGKVLRNERYFAVVSCLIAVFCFFIIKQPQIFSMKSAMLSFPFFIFGYLIRNIDFRKIPHRLVILLLCIIYVVFIIPLNGRCGIDECSYGNYIILFYINAIIGSISIIILSTYINSFSSLFVIIGQNTLGILGTHNLFGIPFKTLVVFICGYNILTSPIYIIASSSIITIASLFFSIYINKHLPFVVGKKIGISANTLSNGHNWK